MGFEKKNVHNKQLLTSIRFSEILNNNECSFVNETAQQYIFSVRHDLVVMAIDFGF